MSYCRSCGNEAQKGHRFCTNCGASITQSKNHLPKRQKPNQEDVSPHRTANPSAANPNIRDADPRLGVLSCVLAVFWLLFSSGFLARIINLGRFDGDDILWAAARADWITAGFFVGLPLAVTALRAPLDKVLIPVEILKAALPYRLLIALGLVAPFIVTWVLSSAFGLQGYGLLHSSVFFGMLITYIIMREPMGLDE